MALKCIPYRTVRAVLRDYLPAAENDKTGNLIGALNKARARGYLTPAELEAVCRWKSARVIGRIKSNSASAVRSATRAALSTRSERRRLEALTSLNGVSIPMASALLMLIDPRRYGVIDIRAWQLLYKLGAVTTNKHGRGFHFDNWYQYLTILRYFAKEFGVPVRDVGRALFSAHSDFQRGRLYE